MKALKKVRLGRTKFEQLVQMGVREEDVESAEEKIYNFLCGGGLVPFDRDELIEIIG